MEKKFHINREKGTISLCRAQEIKNCPFSGTSGVENHYGSIREAKVAYEAIQAEKTFANTQKASGGKGRKIKYSEEKYVEREKVFPKKLVEQEIYLNNTYTERKHFGDVDGDADFTVHLENGEYFNTVQTYGVNAQTVKTGPYGSVDAALNKLHHDYKAVDKELHENYDTEVEKIFPMDKMNEAFAEGSSFYVRPQSKISSGSEVSFLVYKATDNEYYACSEVYSGTEYDTGAPIVDQEENGPYDTLRQAAGKAYEMYREYEDFEPDYESMLGY